MDRFYTKRRFVEFIERRVICNHILFCKRKNNEKTNYKELHHKIEKSIETIFKSKDRIYHDDYIKEFPFIAGFDRNKPRICGNLIPTEQIIDYMLYLADDLNIAVKKDNVTGNIRNSFYKMKKEMMRLIITMRRNRIVKEQFQVEPESGEKYVFYSIKMTNGETTMFHQPWRNVRTNYSSCQIEEFKNNSIEYHKAEQRELSNKQDVDVLMAKFFLVVNYARLRMYRDYFKNDSNCPDTIWRNILKNVY